jgi:hypothetical protein
MLTGTLEPVSNAETWQDNIEFYDDETGDAYSLASATEITLKLRDRESGSTVLSGSMTGGEIDIVGAAADGVVQFTFAASTMSALDPKTYEVGVLLSTSSLTRQLILGTLPVLEGL